MPEGHLLHRYAAELSRDLAGDAGRSASDPAAPDERWVYKRETCRSCRAGVRTEQIGGRTAYWCPVEQPIA